MRVGHLLEVGDLNEVRIINYLISYQCSNSIVSYLGQGSRIVLKFQEFQESGFDQLLTECFEEYQGRMTIPEIFLKE